MELPHPPGPDLRICCVGDSYTQGVGDREGGWVGRLSARAYDRGDRLTAYNLGVRRETSADVAGRWYDEAAPRLVGGDAHGVVFAFGLNDSTYEDGAPRVAPDDSVRNLRSVLEVARGAGWPALVVGVPPIPDGDTGRGDLASLEAAFGAACAELAVPFVPVHDALRGRPEWWQSIDAYGDTAHCGPVGHAMLADLVGEGGWQPWLDGLAGREPARSARGAGGR
ncbi:GDSL-type esterase/lipase family protein [Streptomycetaceae bacterium NBC_01309]